MLAVPAFGADQPQNAPGAANPGITDITGNPPSRPTASPNDAANAITAGPGSSGTSSSLTRGFEGSSSDVSNPVKGVYSGKDARKDRKAKGGVWGDGDPGSADAVGRGLPGGRP